MWALTPLSEAMLITRPQPCAFMCGSAASIVHLHAHKPIRKARSNSASSLSSIRAGPLPAQALLTRISTGPALAIIASTLARSVTLTVMALAGSPIAATSASSLAVSKSAMTTAAPCAAKAVAMPRPMPSAAPVISARRPANLSPGIARSFKPVATDAYRAAARHTACHTTGAAGARFRGRARPAPARRGGVGRSVRPAGPRPSPKA